MKFIFYFSSIVEHMHNIATVIRESSVAAVLLDKEK